MTLQSLSEALIVKPEVIVVFTVPEKDSVLTSCADETAEKVKVKTITLNNLTNCVCILCMNYSPNSHNKFLRT